MILQLCHKHFSPTPLPFVIPPKIMYTERIATSADLPEKSGETAVQARRLLEGDPCECNEHRGSFAFEGRARLILSADLPEKAGRLPCRLADFWRAIHVSATNTEEALLSRGALVDNEHRGRRPPCCLLSEPKTSSGYCSAFPRTTRLPLQSYRKN